MLPPWQGVVSVGTSTAIRAGAGAVTGARRQFMQEPTSAHSLDPATADSWRDLRAQGHRMLDDMFDYIERIRERPVWQPIPEEVRAAFREPLPRTPTDLASAHAVFLRDILPFAVGNAHPGFMGWVHGGGTTVGMLAEMLAAGLNANVGGRNQIPIEVECQIVRWMGELFGFPDTRQRAVHRPARRWPT